MVLLTPPPHKLRDLLGLVDTSSQVSAPDDAKMTEASLEEIPSPTVETPGPKSSKLLNHPLTPVSRNWFGSWA